jgi:hypothetical protein
MTIAATERSWWRRLLNHDDVKTQRFQQPPKEPQFWAVSPTCPSMDCAPPPRASPMSLSERLRSLAIAKIASNSGSVVFSFRALATTGLMGKSRERAFPRIPPQECLGIAISISARAALLHIRRRRATSDGYHQSLRCFGLIHGAFAAIVASRSCIAVSTRTFSGRRSRDVEIIFVPILD